MKKRRAKVLIGLLMLIVIAPLSFCVYKETTKPPPIKILWQHKFSNEMLWLIMHPREQGGVTVLGTQELAIFDGEGNLLTPSSPVLGTHGMNNPGPIVDSHGNAYLTRLDAVISYDTFGKKRWETQIPNANTAPSGTPFRLAFARVSTDDKILVALTSGEFTELDPDGQVIRHTQCDPNLGFFSAPVELPGHKFIAISVNNASIMMGLYAVMVDFDGNLLWDSSNMQQVINRANVYNSMIALQVFGSYVSFSNSLGQPLWEYENPDPPFDYTFGQYYEIRSDGDNVIYIASGSNLVAFTNDGDELWKLRANNFFDCTVESTDIQYAIDADFNKAMGNFRTWLSFLSMRYRKDLVSYIPENNTPCLLLKVVDGKVTKRWSVPLNITQIAGPGADGELYLFSGNDNIIYCVKPE